MFPAFNVDPSLNVIIKSSLPSFTAPVMLNPFAPTAPVAPVAPCIPCKPCGPAVLPALITLPSSKVICKSSLTSTVALATPLPAGPTAPVAPVLPCIPCGPCGPVVFPALS